LSEGKHRAESSRRPATTLLVLVAIVVVVAIGVGAYLAASGDSSSPSTGAPATTSAATPPFAFHVGDAVAIPTTDIAAKKLRTATAHAADAVAETMSGLYAAAFLDPANWRAGSYSSVWSYFDGAAAATARRDVEDLTAGTKAGDDFESITPGRGKLDVKVLFDERNRPAGYSAQVVFTASAAAASGGGTRLYSSGTYFLQPAGGRWRITSFDVARDDHPLKAAPSAAPSGATP
jgi:hypothetical protein